MQKIVVDTNIIISALNFGGTPKDVLELAREGKIRNVISPQILAETERILVNRFHWQEDVAEDTLEGIKNYSSFVKTSEIIDIVLDDPDDNCILECAVAGKADFIVTGDKHLLKLKKFRRIVILTPADFLKAVEK